MIKSGLKKNLDSLGITKFVHFFIGFSFFTAICFGQTNSWEYQTIKDEFDGKIKTCYIVGIGSEFPYETPKFVINKRHVSKDTVKKIPEDTLNIYISDVPYSSCEVNNVKIKFDISETIFYPRVTMNPGRKEWFLEILNEDEFHEFIKLLKTGKQMTVRLYSNCISQFTARFSLSGSTVAIDYISK